MIDFKDGEFIYTVRFKGNKIVLFTIEYLDFAEGFESYVSKKDERIRITKLILNKLDLKELNNFPWGKMEYFMTPLILLFSL